MAHDRRAELLDVIRSVRNRWRAKLALRGAVFVLAGTLLALFLSASSLEALRFSPTAIILFRFLALAVFALLVAYFMVRPLLHRVTDTQVAMYLEERDPTLEAAILSAVEASSDSPAAFSYSPRLVDRLVEQAIEQCRNLQFGKIIERKALRRNLGALVAVAVVAMLIIAFGPLYLRHGLTALVNFSRDAEAASPYSSEVRPGEAKVPRGSDQVVNAKLVGFASKDASLMTRTSSGAAFERIPLVQNLLRNIDFRRYYLDVMEDLLEGEFTPEALDARMRGPGDAPLWPRLSQAAYLESNTPAALRKNSP